MNSLKNRFQFYIFSIPVIILLIYGVIFESPYGERKILLISLTIIFAVFIIIKLLIKDRICKIVFILLIGINLMIIEYNSKFAINYFFHIIYYFELVFAVINVKRKESLFLGVFLVFTSILKFIQLIIIKPTTTNILLSLFFIINNFLVLIIVYLAKNYREESKRTKELYDELLVAHRKLRDYSKNMKELASYEERTRIARDLHDTLGHEMTGLIMQMEISSNLLAKGDEIGAKKMLDDSKKSARESLGKVREIVNALKNEEEPKWANESITKLINDFVKKTNVKISCSINGIENIEPDISVTIYRIIQEALTNAVRHGKASSIEVNINYEKNFIKLMIKDNGKGCSNLQKGNGLKGMAQRVKRLEGTLNIINNNGLTILVKIPTDKYKS